MTAPSATATLPWTGNPDADALISTDPLALLIGFVLDQQVPIEKAFSGPQVLRDRLGTLDACELAAIDPEQFTEACVRVPAIHRFPAAMAGRIQLVCRIVCEQHGGHAERIWTEARDAAGLKQRLAELPGFGPMKATTMAAVLAKRFNVRPSGWESLVPEHLTLADVVDKESLVAYRAFKRERKRALREAT